jgi:hypothetical protein
MMLRNFNVCIIMFGLERKVQGWNEILGSNSDQTYCES